MRKVLLIGWDAADWKVIHPLMDRGEMPGLQSLVDQGAIGNLSTIHPVLSPMLWTSIATGKRPFKHGIHGFTEPDPNGNSIRPVSSYSRRCKAVWNMLQHHDLRSIVLGWWPSHPTEPIDGVMVSNHFHRATDSIEQPWPLDPDCVHPPELGPQLAEMRVHPGELVAEQLLPFIPKVKELQREKDPRIASLAKILADCASVQAVATSLIDSQPWDLMAVYFDAIDHFSHGFMKFHPPQQTGIADEDFQLFKDVIAGAYRFHDMMLQRLLASVDDETTVILISDHGFHPDHLRPSTIPHEPAGPAIEHRDHGIFIAKGPGIRADHLIHGASVIDITPTLLTLFDLPVGKDMDGQPLMDIFTDPPDVQTIDSWEQVPGECGMHPTEKQLDAVESREAINQLVALGYIEKPSENVELTIRRTIRESRYNLAQSLMDAGQMGDAIEILEPLWEEYPTEYRLGVKLAACYQSMARTADQRRVVEAILARRQQEAQTARQSLQELHATLAKRQAEQANQPKVVEPAESEAKPSADKDGVDEFDALLLSVEEQQEFYRLKAAASYNPHFAFYSLATVCFAEEKYDQALANLKKAEDIQPHAFGMLNMLGSVYLAMERLDDATRNFERVLEKDPNDPKAHLGLARVALATGRAADAVPLCLKAIGLQYQLPMAHFVLGVALQDTGNFDAAIDAFSVTLTQNPRSVKAHRRLARLHKRQNNLAAANEHEAIANAILNQTIDETPPVNDTALRSSPARTDKAVGSSLPPIAPVDERAIVVVSGLPRSGTSMLMQMLAAGGLTPLADEERLADDDNPRGYFEYAPVRELREDSSWMPSARGKLLKVVAPLLPYLPAGERYRIVLADRALGEVLASQQTMLNRRGTSGSSLSPDSLRQVFERQLASVMATLAQREDVELLIIGHSETIVGPKNVAAKVAAFLGMDLDIDKMAAVVDPELYRNRHPSTIDLA